MSIIRENFGTIPNGEKIDLITITNESGASISVSTLGAGLVRVIMPDKNNQLGDCILGFDNPTDYLDPDKGYQGLVVGRVANRIANGRFTLDGIEYNVTKNSDNRLCLHGAGRFSFNQWNIIETTDESVTLSFFSPDMQDGFPGDFICVTKYTLTEDNTVRIEYKASSDRKTIASLTNHSYFNLSCDESLIHDHYMKVNADSYLETSAEGVPSGEILSVDDTPMNFREFHQIGERIDEDFPALNNGKGYDHCYVINSKPREFTECAVLEDRKSGRRMSVYTDMPAMQIYTANCLGECMGKNGLKSGFRRAVCFETQFQTDFPNQPDFMQGIIDENEPLITKTEFRFSVIND